MNFIYISHVIVYLDKTAFSFASTVREKGGLCLSPVQACTFFRNWIHCSFYCNDFCDNVQFEDMAFQSEIDEMINKSHNPPLGEAVATVACYSL